MKSKSEIARQFADHKAITNRGLSLQRENDELCEAFYNANYMSLSGEVGSKRVAVQFSKPKPYIMAVVGFMLQNQRQAKYVARKEDKDEQELYTKNCNSVAGYIRKNASAQTVESQANKNMLIRGYGAVETALTYDECYATRDPNGEIIMGDVTDELGWDPSARKPNLLDARWIYYRKSYGLEDAKTLFDEPEEEFTPDSSDTSEQAYHYDPTIYPYDRAKLDLGYEWDVEREKKVWVYFYQWIEIEKFYRADNPITNLQTPIAMQMAMMKMRAIADEVEQEDSLFKFDPTAEVLTFDGKIKAKLIEEFGDQLKVYDYPRQVFYTAVVSGSKVFKAFRSVSQQGFSIKVKTGDWDNSNKIWVGLIQGMMEPTRYYNKSLTEMMYTLAANSKGGVIIEDDAVDDINEFEDSYNSTDGIVTVRPGALSGGKIQDKAKPALPTGYENILQISDQAIAQANGFDPMSLASPENKMETAMLHRQRVRQVMSVLAPYFFSETKYQEEHAGLLLDYMPIYAENNRGMIIRIVGDGAEDFIRLTEDLFMAEYDIDIQEAPTTPEEKEQQAQILLTLAQSLQQIGDPAFKVCYASALKYMNLEQEDRITIGEALVPKAQNPEVIALQQQVQQLTSEMNQIQLATMLSQKSLNEAKAQQTIADTQKKLEEAKRTAVETQLVPLTELSNININI